MNQKPSLKTLLFEVDDAFWQIVVKHYPEATTGDLCPFTTFRLHEAQRVAVERWTYANVPEPPG